MAASIRSSFTVRFLRTGDQLYTDVSIVRFDANGTEQAGSLLQVIDTASGTLSVNWATDLYNQPCIKVGVTSAQGNTVTTTGIAWTYQGTAITFNATAASSGDYAGWNLSTDGNFAKKESGGYCYLRIINNIASSTIISNQTVGYTVSYVVNGQSGTPMSGTEDIIIQQGGSNSYYVNIITDVTQLSTSAASTTLTAQCVYGTDTNVTIDGTTLRYQWLKNFTDISGANGASYSVTRDDVDGSTVFSLELQRKNGSTWETVASDSQRITDVSDEWQARLTPTSDSSGMVSKDSNAKFTLELYRNNVEYTDSTVTWAWDVYNALNELKHSGTGSAVTITADYAQCENDNGTYYSDVGLDVDVSVE